MKIQFTPKALEDYHYWKNHVPEKTTNKETLGSNQRGTLFRNWKA